MRHSEPYSQGKRMANCMGHVTATVQSLTVMSADAENNVLAIKGAIPGFPRAASSSSAPQ